LVFTGAGGSNRLSEEQFQRLKQALEELHVGAANAGRAMLLKHWRRRCLQIAALQMKASAVRLGAGQCRDACGDFRFSVARRA
jgi:phage portal protein BeeE